MQTQRCIAGECFVHVRFCACARVWGPLFCVCLSRLRAAGAAAGFFGWGESQCVVRRVRDCTWCTMHQCACLGTLLSANMPWQETLRTVRAQRGSLVLCTSLCCSCTREGLDDRHVGERCCQTRYNFLLCKRIDSGQYLRESTFVSI